MMPVQTMMRMLLAVALSNCSRGTPTLSRAGEEPVADCTHETRLVPGVPGSPGHWLPSPINPNGASELAALMRRMQGDLLEARRILLEGGAPGPLGAHHRRIRCSWPTDPSDRNATFDGMAVAYLAAVSAFDQQPTVTHYEGVVSGCAACHEHSCSGPLEAINALRTTAR